ncbi:protein translocase subunit SecD [Phenylobacterium sp.]|uniref:protein translocase subunit SecD n=1 Tax=Phenylobacterium sp. TaxID=1871053 RepID=UPI0026000C73|nr:protein translocase subunit SecD [Phenylobacterium sp.]
MINVTRWKVIVVVLATLFGIFFTLPNLLPASVRDALPAFVPHKTLALGLDLQGGSYLLYEVDTAALRNEKLTGLTEDARTTLTKAQIPFTGLSVVSGEVNVRISDPNQVAAAAAALRQEVGAPLAGAAGGREVAVSLMADQRVRIAFVGQAFESQATKAVTQSIEVIRRRIDELGTKEPDIRQQGSGRIMISAPGESDPAKLRDLVGKTAKLTFQMVDVNADPIEAQQGRAPPGSMIVPGDDRAPYYVVKRRPVVTGEMLTDAQGTFDNQTARPVVSFRFNAIGAKKFGEATTENIGKPFAIILDNKVISAPTINGAITGGSGIITGNFTTESANNLAILLRAGALPAPLKVQEQRTVGAELGADSIRAGAISLMIGAAAIIVFIVLAYGLFGIFAAFALIVNVLLILGIMSMTQATLTFPGIAGLILTLAVAVDANVLIYERIRDEAHAGRPPIMALEHGFSRALVSIIDANITSLISAIIMFLFGAGPIRGFAWTLLIGVFTSVFTAVVITQLLIGWWFQATKPKKLPIE